MQHIVIHKTDKTVTKIITNIAINKQAVIAHMIAPIHNIKMVAIVYHSTIKHAIMIMGHIVIIH